MKSLKIFGFYTLLCALFVVGLAAGLSNASSDTILMDDGSATVPTRSPITSGTVPTRTPTTGGTIPTRTPQSGGTVPTRTPVVSDGAASDESTTYPTNSPSEGGMITLQSASADADDWVVIEWQAGDGTWIQVDGWRGHINNGEISWWVGSDNLGEGPFRWVIYRNESEAEQLKVSEPFSLPDSENSAKTFVLEW